MGNILFCVYRCLAFFKKPNWEVKSRNRTDSNLEKVSASFSSELFSVEAEMNFLDNFHWLQLRMNISRFNPNLPISAVYLVYDPSLSSRL